MTKKIAEAVRAGYERRPYPAVKRAELRRPPWRLPALDWINSIAQPMEASPRRVLVAGCGTGIEAFAWRRRCPQAEIVGVDFAGRSIAEAKRLQKRATRLRDIRFVQADLTSDRLRKITGGNFDFISCHGVMTYLPEPIRALRNLARCLTPNGVLYLGVNGATHFSESWRKFLSAFGFEMECWPGGDRLWRHLKLVGPLAGDVDGKVISYGSVYLASDLFGSMIRNLPLSKWVRSCRRAGLHFRGNYGATRHIWSAINNNSYELLMPRSRPEVAALVDLVKPDAFYELIFSRAAEIVPPWDQPRAFSHWRPVRTNFARSFRLAARGSARVFELKNREANISIELRGADWELDFLRASNGERSVREILASLSHAVKPAALRSQLYLFYLLNLLNFLPPPSRRKERRSA